MQKTIQEQTIEEESRKIHICHELKISTMAYPKSNFVDQSMLASFVAVGDMTDLPEKEDEYDTNSESDVDDKTSSDVITFSSCDCVIPQATQTTNQCELKNTIFVWNQ